MSNSISNKLLSTQSPFQFPGERKQSINLQGRKASVEEAELLSQKIDADKKRSTVSEHKEPIATGKQE